MSIADESFARAILRPALVVLLAEGGAHGYGLFLTLRDVGLPLGDVGAVYKALRTLEQDRLLTSRWDTAVRRGPSRRVYRLTARGRREIEASREQLRHHGDVIATVLRRYEGLRRLDVGPVRDAAGDGAVTG